MRFPFVTGMLLVPLLACNGCALLTLSTLSSVASLGNSSTSVGRQSYFWGKLHTAEMSSFDEARAAVRATAADFGLRPKGPEEIKDKGTRSEMGFIDDHGTAVGVRIEKRAEHLVWIRLDVGWWFGSEVNDRLFLARLRAHLPDPNARSSPAE